MNESIIFSRPLISQMTDQFRDRFVVNFFNKIRFTFLFLSNFQGEKGYDTLKKLMKNGNDFCIDVAKCLQER